MTPFTLGFDVGGTRVKAGAVDPRGKVLLHTVSPTRAESGPRQLLALLAGQVRHFTDKLGRAPRGIALGLSGAVDPRRGAVLLPGKFKGLEGFPIVPRLAKRTGVPVTADNDARLAMIAEQHYGLARGRRWVVMITIGTGVGSGVVLDGKILRDPHLQFGTQMSHTVIQCQDGKLCLTGARGTAESLCSATALAMAVRDGLHRGIPSLLADRYWADPHAVDFAAVMDAVARKDRLCLDELRRWTEKLGWLLVSATHVYAPELIILGGGGAHAARHFLKPLRAHVNAHLFRHPAGDEIPIRVSKLGDHAGVLGAAARAWECVER